MLFEVSADKELSEGVNSPDVPICRVELYEVRVSENLKRYLLVLLLRFRLMLSAI